MMKENNPTTTRPNPEAAAEIVRAIKAQKPLTPEAEAHLARAALLRQQADKVEDRGDYLGAAEIYYEVVRECAEAGLIEPHAKRPQFLTAKAAYMADVELNAEFSKAERIAGKKGREKNPEEHAIIQADIQRVSVFAQIFSRKLETELKPATPGWRKVIENLTTLVYAHGGETPPTFPDPEKSVKGAELQIDTGIAWGPEIIDSFEERHKTREGAGSPGHVDIVRKGNIAVECKNYPENNINLSTVGGWVDQASTRFIPDLDTHRIYDKVVIIVPNEVDVRKTQQLVDEQIKKKKLDHLFGKITVGHK